MRSLVFVILLTACAGILFAQEDTLVTADPSPCQIAWTTCSTMTADPIHDVHFLNDSTGWACTYGTGAILKTTDSGRSWSKTCQLDSVYYEQLQFPTYNTGFICGGNNQLLKSSDGGTSWKRLSLPMRDTVSDLTLLYSMVFTSDKRGLVGRSHFNHVGNSDRRTIDWSGGSHEVLETLDGGITWRLALSPPQTMLFEFQYADTSTFFVSGESSICKSVDGGSTWQPVFLDSSRSLGRIRGVWFASRHLGCAVTWGGYVLRTSDRGLSWNTLKISNAPLRSICFLNDSVGVAVGNADDCPLFVTTDYGSSWTRQQGNYPDLHRAQKSNNYLWVCGKRGTILKGHLE